MYCKILHTRSILQKMANREYPKLNQSSRDWCCCYFHESEWAIYNNLKKALQSNGVWGVKKCLTSADLGCDFLCPSGGGGVWTNPMHPQPTALVCICCMFTQYHQSSVCAKWLWGEKSCNWHNFTVVWDLNQVRMRPYVNNKTTKDWHIHCFNSSFLENMSLLKKLMFSI